MFPNNLIGNTMIVSALNALTFFDALNVCIMLGINLVTLIITLKRLKNDKQKR